MKLILDDQLKNIYWKNMGVIWEICTLRKYNMKCTLAIPYVTSLLCQLATQQPNSASCHYILHSPLAESSSNFCNSVISCHWVCLHVFFWEVSPVCNELKMGTFYFEYSYKRTTSMVVVCSWHFFNKLSDLKHTDDNFERSWRRLEKIDIKTHSNQSFYSSGMKKMFYIMKLWRFC